MWGKDDKKPEQQPTPQDPKPSADKPQISAEEMLAKMGELLNPLSKSISDTNARINQLEERSRPRRAEGEEDPNKIPSVLDDEDVAFQKRLGPVVVQQIRLQAQMTERDILGELGEWQEYSTEIKKVLADTPLSVKANSDAYEAYVRNVVDMVVGREARKGGLKRRGSTFVLEDASGSRGDNSTSQLADEDRSFLNYTIDIRDRNGHSKKITRREFLERNGVMVEKDGKLVESHDLSDPAVLAAARKTFSSMQVIN